jgi:hypothetical protein
MDGSSTMPTREFQVNTDGDVIAYDGHVLEIFFLDGSKRFVASRLRYDRGGPDRSGAVIVQLWATAAQMVGMVRVEAEHVGDLDALLAAINGPAAP